MSDQAIGIVDLGICNLRSISNALYSLGFDPVVVRAPDEAKGPPRLLIPGVGSYDEAARKLDSTGLRAPILEHARAGRPLLGICLGMQLLSTMGEEGDRSRGLDLIPGTVRRIQGGPGLPVPHVGWNSVELDRKHPVFEGVKTGVDFYFVHSYHFACGSDADRWGTTEYGERFVSVVGRANVAGVQFHPEKSQANGLRILENFGHWNGRLSGA